MIKVELLLRDYLKKISTNYQDFYCVHIHSSKLADDSKKDYKIQLILNSLQPLMQQGKTRFFHIFNDDFFIFYQEKHRDEINTIMMKIKFHFSDDENIRKLNIPLTSLYNVDSDAVKLKEVINHIFEGIDDEIDMGRRMPNTINKLPPIDMDKIFYTDKTEKKALKKKLTPAALGRIENSLKQVDFSSIIRRQSVCAIYGKSFPQPLFDEVFVAISDLQETLMPDIDITSSPWLFKHLTEVLDKGVLLSVGKHDYGSLKMEFSINMNVTTLISSEFARFDEKINPSLKSTIVLELNPSDVFSDLHTYILARDYARNKGYRICLDGLSLDMLRYLDKEKLGVDLVKIFWSQEFLEEVSSDKNRVIESIQRFGDDRVILSRVDDSIAVDIGQGLGISLFQGRHINSIISSDPRKRRVGSVIINR